MDVDIQHGRGHAAWANIHTLLVVVHVCAICLCLYCTSMSMLHVSAHAGYLYPYCMFIVTLRVHIHAAWEQTYSMNMDLRHGHGLAVWIRTCSMDMQHGNEART
jgi:hypothetical protein